MIFVGAIHRESHSPPAFLLVFVGFIFLFFTAGASAQIVPTSAEPERLEKQFKEAPRLKSTFEAVIPDTPVPPHPSELEKIKFTMSWVAVEESTVYINSDFAPLFKEFVNQEISLVEVYQIAEAITAKYRNDGYILSRAIVPPQRIQAGIVLIQVIEGFIDKVTIEGDVKGSLELLYTYRDKIIYSRPLRAKDLERYLLLIGDLPGVTVKSVLSPSDQNFGASHLTLFIEHKIMDGHIGMDNRGSRFNGPYQGSVGVNLNSVLGRYERTGVRVINTTDTQEMLFISTFYEQPLGTEGTKVILSGNIGKIEPGHTLEEFDVDGESFMISLAVTHPFIRSRGKNLSANAGFTSRNSRTDILGSKDSEDRVRVLNFGVSYDFVDRFRGVNLLGFGLNQGIDIFNATESGSSGLTREGGKSDFTKVTANVMRLQQLIPQWMLLVSAEGQYAFDELLASEEFGIGGSRYGRAYDSFEIVGDHGIASKAELQYARKVGRKYLKGIQPYLFFDYGSVWEKKIAGGGNKQEALTSTGAGIRYNLTERASGYVEASKPLSRRVSAEGDKDVRIFFSLALRF